MQYRKQIIAMGGGGFSMEPENSLLDRYIIEAAGKEDPAVCFLPTASADSSDYIVRFYAAFFKGSCTPHYDGESERRGSYHSLLENGELPAGYALDDGAAAHFIGGELFEVVTSRETAKAFRVRSENGGIIEVLLPTRFLGEWRRVS